MSEFLQQIINGLSWGAIYALIAVGYTMVYGVLRLINFAHGDIYMIGAMAGLYVVAGFSLPVLVRGLFHHPFWIAMLAVVALALLAALVLGVLRYRVPRMLQSLVRVMAALFLAALVVDVGHRLIAWTGSPSWLALLIVLCCAVVACASLGYVIELAAYRPLRNQPRIAALITAIGVSMFLEFGGQAVFGATPQAFPALIPGMEERPILLDIGQYFHAPGTILITKADAFIFIVALVLMVLLRHIVLNTKTGLALRAVSFRFDTAALMGVNTDRIISFTFVLGSALAAVAGVLVAIRSPKVEPLMGLIPGIKAFIAAVLGGIGNIAGAVAGGFLLGLIEVLVAGYFPQGSQYRDGVAFVILIVVLLVRPSGLFGQASVEKV